MIWSATPAGGTEDDAVGAARATRPGWARATGGSGLGLAIVTEIVLP
ncbi:hypothetical protein [Nocardia sp. NPDC047654]